MSAVDIVVPSAMPQEFNYQLPASLPSAKTYEVRVQPVNSQTFSGTGGAVVQFDVPCGKRGAYLDTSTTYVKFKATYTHAGAAGTDYSYLLGSGYSYFNKAEVYGNNSVLLESINEHGVLGNMMCNLQLNASDKTGLAPGFGFNDSVLYSQTNCGHQINYDTLNALTFTYAMPLVGILGSGTEKFFPIGDIYGLRYELTCDAYANITAGITANKVNGLTLTEFELCGQVVELDATPQSMIEMANPNIIHIRSNSYRTATNFLSASSTGLQDLLIGTRVSSLKSIFATFSPSNAPEGKFASVCPNLGQGSCFVLAGQNLPQRTLNPVNHPADTFMELQKSIGALSSTQFNGCTNKRAFNTSSTAQGQMLAYNNVAANVLSNPSTFILGINTEIVSHRGGLLSGININTSPSFLRCQIVSALSAFTHTVYIFAHHDTILEIDRNAKTIVAKF